MTITVPMRRSYGRATDELRPVTIETGVVPHAEGSAMITVGKTQVLCVATVEEDVPRWMKGRGTGWVTAEYGMLPRSTDERTRREAKDGKQGGRTQEIQRLIGRSLRAVTNMKALGERQVILDCDVIIADGGTRCASITGAWVALSIACNGLLKAKKVRRNPITGGLAAVSVGVLNNAPVLDLDYSEDSKADVDANIVMTNRGDFVEIQFTAEQRPFSGQTLQEMLGLAEKGIADLVAAQTAALNVK